jgi:hypothetical protein
LSATWIPSGSNAESRPVEQAARSSKCGTHEAAWLGPARSSQTIANRYCAVVPGGREVPNAGQHRINRKGNGRVMVVRRPRAAPGWPRRSRLRGRGCHGDGAVGVYVGAARQHHCRRGRPDGPHLGWDVLRVADGATRRPTTHGSLMRQPRTGSSQSWRLRAAGSSCRAVSRMPATPRSTSTRPAASARPWSDYRIVPQPGSLNPWQRQAAPGGRYTVTIRSGPAAGQADTLPPPAGTTRQHPGLPHLPRLPAGRGQFLGRPGSGADGGARARGAHAPRLPHPQRSGARPGDRLRRGPGRDRVPQRPRHPHWRSTSPSRAHSTTRGSPTSTPPMSWLT